MITNLDLLEPTSCKKTMFLPSGESDDTVSCSRFIATVFSVPDPSVFTTTVLLGSGELLKVVKYAFVPSGESSAEW